MGAGELASFFCAKLDPTKDLIFDKTSIQPLILGGKVKRKLIETQRVQGLHFQDYGV